jgi:hypothetical protein
LKSTVRQNGVNVQDASAESSPDLQLEIAYFLLIDVVGYSKLLVNEQVELLQELNRIVRSTECFRAAVGISIAVAAATRPTLAQTRMTRQQRRSS